MSEPRRRGAPIPRPGDGITWTHIGPDGSERQRTGQVWSDGPRTHASPTFWVRAHQRVPREPSLLLVCRPAKRVRAGRYVPITARFARTGGRYVEVGELFSESDAASVLGGASLAGAADDRPPQAIRQPPIPADALAYFMAMGGGPKGDAFPGRYPDVEGGIDRAGFDQSPDR